MSKDFARTLSLLRREKKLSQRKVATDLNISQALLSHYENGVREPGLEFVARAADYYTVSCDFLLGRSMSRNGAAIYADDLPDVTNEKGNVVRGNIMGMLQKKLIVNSSALIIELLSKTDSRELLNETSAYITLSLYKMYRYMYMASPEYSDDYFTVPSSFFSDFCDIEMKLCEQKIKAIVTSNETSGKKSENLGMPPMTPPVLDAEFPALSQSLFALLHSASEKLEKYMNNIKSGA